MSHDDFVFAVKQVTETIRRFGQGFLRAAIIITDKWYEIAAVTYRKEVGPLPGSDRTSRLRKKRRKLVMGWFSQWISEGGHDA